MLQEVSGFCRSLQLFTETSGQVKRRALLNVLKWSRGLEPFSDSMPVVGFQARKRRRWYDEAFIPSRQLRAYLGFSVEARSTIKP
jgi:hypothetical protein